MEKSLLFQGKKICYTCCGSGKAIVFLHGFMESGNIWDGFSEALSKEFTVLTIDLPGHGKSEVVAEIHTMSLMSESVRAVMEDAGVESAVIVGHSMGGYIALEFGKMFPEKVNGIVLFHSHGMPDSPDAKENRRRTINIVKQNKTGFIRQFIPDLFDQNHVEKYSSQISGLIEESSKMSAEGVIAALSGMRDREGGLAYLMTTDRPVLFIVGKQDPRIPYNQLLAQAVIPAHSETLILDNVGHMGFIEAPETTLQTIRHFAAKCFGE